MLIGVTTITVRTVSAWLAKQVLVACLLYNAKDAANFYSCRWNIGTNADLVFASVGPNSCLLDRRVFKKFPSSHRPLLITTPGFTLSVPSMPVKRWNFRKDKRSHYIALTNKFAKTLLPAPTTSHLNVVVQSPSLHWGGSKWLVNFPRVSSSGDSPLDNSSHFLSLLSNARSHVDSTLKPN